MLITVMTGKEIFPERETQIYAFFVPSNQFPGNGVHLFQKAKEPFADKPVRTNGSANMVSARNGYRQDLAGFWTTQVFDIDENVILKIIGRVSARGVSYQGGCLLQARQGAPLIRVEIPLTGRSDAPFSVAYVEGRFDVLAAPQALQEGATGLSTMDVKAFMPVNRDRVMRVRELSPETQGRVVVASKVVENAAGEQVQVSSARRRRRIDV